MNPKVTRLSKHLQLNYKRDQVRTVEDAALIPESEWAASRLIFQFLEIATLRKILIPRDLHRFHQQYEVEYKLKIDLGGLIEKQWIRFVAGDIQVASGASHLIYALGHKDQNDDYAKHYEKELLFLEKLKDRIWSTSTTLSLAKKDIVELLQSYQQIFPDAPNLEDLQNLQVLKASQDEDIFILNRSSTIWKGCSELIAAKYWMKLVKDHSFKDDIQRLVAWKRIFLQEGYLHSHFQELLDNETKKRFVDACLQLVLKEEDLNWSENEVVKWWIDGHTLRNPNGPEHFPHKFTFNCSTHFELFSELKDFTNHFYWTTLQASRLPISFFIRQILYADSRYLSDSKLSFSRTRELFSGTFTKPYLMWVLSEALENAYPEAIPYLLLETETAAWGMLLLEKISPANSFYGDFDRSEQALSIRTQVSETWLAGFEVVLDSLSISALTNMIKIDAMFDILYPIALNSSEQVTHGQFHLADAYRSRYLKAIQLLESHRINRNHGSATLLKPYLFPYLIRLLAEKVKKANTKVPFNEIKSVDVGRWEMFFLILRLCNTPYSAEEIDTAKQKILQEVAKNAIGDFLDYYQREFNLNEIEVQNYFEAFPQKKAVKWRSEPFALSHLDWWIFCKKLAEHNSLKIFFNAYQFDLPDKRKGAALSDSNNPSIQKCRIYLRILLLMHQTISRRKHQFLTEQIGTNEFLRNLEEEIIEVAKNNVDAPETGVIDIFNSLYEGDALHYYGEGLLSHLFRLAGDFQEGNKKKLLAIFIESDLDRLLLIHNFLKIPSEKTIIKEAIDQIDIEDFVKKIKWYTVLENALIQAINSDEHLEVAEKLLPYFEKNLARFKQFQHNKVLIYFQIKAVQAWRKDELETLKTLSLPSEIQFTEKAKTNFFIFKNLILGAYYDKHHHYDEALTLFEQLSRADDKNIEIAARLYSVRTNKALSSKKIDLAQLEEAYSSWENFERKWQAEKNNQGFNPFIDTIIFCKMVRAHYNGQDIEFDYYFEKISQAYRYHQQVVEIVVENHQHRGKSTEAEAYLIEAKQYYHQYWVIVPDWVDALRATLNRSAIKEELGKSLNLILAQSPTDLINIIPPKLSGNAQNVAEFLLYQAVESAAMLLEKVTAINRIEDRYNDIFVLILRSRLLPWEWQVFAQSPGGLSSNLKRSDTSGERDWIISTQGRNIGTFEALIWSDNVRKPYIEKHLEKLIKRYSPTLQVGFLVTYYTRKDINFEEEWDKYETTVNALGFADRFSKKENMTAIPYQQGNQNLKVGKTSYGSKTNTIEIFHLYLNMNFGT
jgi:hypothetical protein